jgi:hypothetical protein
MSQMGCLLSVASGSGLPEADAQTRSAEPFTAAVDFYLRATSELFYEDFQGPTCKN